MSRTEEELSAEEQAALKEMQSDSGLEVEGEVQYTPEPAKEPAKEATEQADPGDETDEADEKVEFKTTREKPEDKKPPEGFVPHQAMHAERMRRQELERKLAELEARIPKPEEEKPPEYVDPLEDPEGFRKYDAYRREQEEKRWQQFQETQRRQSALQARAQEASRLEAEFASKTPDYQAAAEFLHNSRVSELRAQGYGDNEVQQTIVRDAHALFDAARAAGMNPAELLYLRAQQAGYQRQEQKQAPTGEAEKLKALADAQKQTQGLGNAGGSQGGKLTVEQLSQMSEKELAKVPEDEIARLFGA